MAVKRAGLGKGLDSLIPEGNHGDSGDCRDDGV